jgi:carbonic anhydrase
MSVPNAHVPVLRLLSANSQWSADVQQSLPDFFENCAKGQSPKVLWIGCADSRVPESVITAAKPGDIFVHRNIANQFHPEDDSALSVLAYAVDFLGVEHVVVVGHTECGGAAACYNAAKAGDLSPPTTPLARWLLPLIKLTSTLDVSDKDLTEALPIIVTENVKKQVENISQTVTMKNAWAEKKNVWVHGLVYEIGTGRLRDLDVSRGA